MSKFTDRTGRDWPIEIDFPEISRIKRDVGIDLLTQDGMTRLTRCESIEDYELLAQVLYLVCAETAERLGVTDEQFGRIASQSFDAATRALNEALADFFRRVGRGPMATMLQTAMAMAATQKEPVSPITIERLLRKSLSITERQLDEQLSQAEHEMDVILGSAPTNSPHSPASATSSSDAA